MDLDKAKAYLLARPEAQLDWPFGPDVMVFKIRGKMFATLSVSARELGSEYAGQACMNLKCDPDEAQGLRDLFAAVLPGYHMNKRHWNTVVLNGSIPAGEIERMIDASYRLVVNKLTRAERTLLERVYSKEELYR